AHSEHPADNALFAHTEANDGMVVAFAPQELDHGNIIRKGGCRADHFVEVGGEGSHLLQSLGKLFRAAKIVEGKNESGAAAKLLQLLRLALLSGLEFNINQLASRSRGFSQDIELGGDGAAKLASARYPPAGGDHHHARVRFQKMFDLRNCQPRLRNMVQPELKKGVITD